MPRLPRVTLENVVYLVSMEGPYQEQIFKDRADYHKYVQLLGKYKEEYGFKLFSYALLPSRLFLLMETKEEFPISQIMQKITPLYTKHYNGRYGRRGPLFQKRFRSVLIEKEAYLARVTRYTHMLAADEATPAFAYSSYGAYAPARTERLDEPVLDLKAEVEEVLHTLPGGDGERAYEHFMTSADKQEFEFLDKKLSRGFFLGSDRFISEVKNKVKEHTHKDNSFTEPPAGDALSSSTGFSMSGRTAVLSGLLVAAICLSVFSVYLKHESFVTLVRTMALAGGAVPEKKVEAPAVPKAAALREAAGLDDTIWEVELISVSEDGVETPVKDRIKFQGEAFESYYFASQGFSPSHYTVTVHANGLITWETVQRNHKGEVVSWRGDWNGKRMEGMLSYRPDGSDPRDFSFMSNQLLGAQT